MRTRGPTRAGFVFVLATIAVAGVARAQTPEGTLFFNDPNDTIRVDGQTVMGSDSTYEAWVLLPTGFEGNGLIFNEWTNFFEDKQFGAGPNEVWGYNHATGGIIQFNHDFPLDTWHHFAFVQEGAASQQRLYVDGALVVTQASSGDISDSDGPAAIGAIDRLGISHAITGFIDSVRVSDNARYSGESFTLPPHDLPSDEHALLLYDFAKEDFYSDESGVHVSDLSGHGRDGTLGIGFLGAQMPAAPATQGDIDCNGSLTASDALKVLRVATGQTIEQAAPCPPPGEKLTTGGSVGDVDCSGSLVASDALKVLLIAVGASATQEQPCAAFKDPV